MKVILDTNVMISAFAARGLCSALLEYCLNRCEIVISEEIFRELSTHIADKLKLPQVLHDRILALLRDSCTISEVSPVDDVQCRDANDLHVLGLARQSGAGCVITGDKDLLELKSYGDTRIVTPREFWQIIRQGGERPAT